MSRLPVWLAAFWWVSLCTLGFWVVPMLFANLPTPALAGGMAAKLFSAQTWVSVVCGLLLLMLTRVKAASGSANRQPPLLQSALPFVMAGMLLALLVEFAVAPRIVARDNLALWHSVGSVMYVLQWLCAGVTFWKLTSVTT
jgi:hypothetical protein